MKKISNLALQFFGRRSRPYAEQHMDDAEGQKNEDAKAEIFTWSKWRKFKE